jgi:PiT family inorganic phosphate transporter
VEATLVILVVVFAAGFDFTNGFHDAANAIATSVSTRALTPRAALIMAAVMNFLGALIGTGVAVTIATEIIDLSTIEGSLNPAEQRLGLVIIFCAIVGAIAWNLITWWLGLPSSSTHSLIGGLVGAGLVVFGFSGVQWGHVVQKVVLPMVFSPLIGFLLAFIVMVGVLWLVRKANPWKATRRFRVAQTASAAAMALGHGLQDAQKTMGIITMALFAIGWWGDPSQVGIPLWVKVLAAGAISAGTATGGWRIMRTLGRKIIDLDPARGFVAETVSAVVLYVTAFGGIHAPVSTTHVITSAIMGVGATKRLSAVRWGVAKNIAVAWVLTIPAAALVAALFTVILRPLLGAGLAS